MELTPEQINTFLANAVLQSQIGKCVQDAVGRVVADLSKSYQNPFDASIKQQVAVLIEKEIQTTYRPQMEARIAVALKAHMTDEVMEKIVKAAMINLDQRY